MSHSRTQTWELVEKAQGGDKDALNHLFERYYERVRRSVRARIGQRLRARMESSDILQSAFAKAFENFDRFEMRNDGSFLHWLAEYAVRQMHDAADRVNAIKRKSPQEEVPLDATSDSGQVVQVPGRVTAPLDRADRRERETLVEACLDQLPESYRSVIVMRDYDGLEWREIQDKLQKNTDSAVRELHRRAVLELAKLVRRRGIDPTEA